MHDPATWEILNPLETHITPSDRPGRLGLRFDCALLRYGDQPTDQHAGHDQRVSRILDFRIEELAAMCRTVLEYVERDCP